MRKISMRKIREILRLKLELKLSNRDIARSVLVSSSTVSDCLQRAKRAGLNWPLPEELTDEKLETMLYAVTHNCEPHNINWQHIHKEMRRKGVTRELLWYEYYKEQQSNGLSYSHFCQLYRDWQQQIDCCMRQDYKAGEKMLVDYAGMTIPVVSNINTGETIEAQIFVSILGASNYIFTEATESQRLADWIGSHCRAFSYYGGVPEILVPDNLKSGVEKAHRYEPDLNPTYADMAKHYNIAIVPTRVKAPRDKAKVEQAVQQVERQILAKLRNRTFFSIQELNDAIKPLLEELNNRAFQKLPGSRKSEFETLEKNTLKPLPQEPYVLANWKKAKPGIDYHVALEQHYYSVPYTLIKKELDVRYTNNIVEIFYHGKRVASHIRSYKTGHTTLTEHMPKSHQEYVQWTPERIINWTKQIGPATAELAEKIIYSRKHPVYGFRSCVGIIRLAKSFGNERVEKACLRALSIGAYSYKSVESILRKNLDQQPLTYQNNIIPNHEYVRGKNYFN